MSEPDPRLEALAEAIVFAHEAEAALPAPGGGVLALERTAALAAAALAGPVAVPERLQRRLAAAGLAFCAERARELAKDGAGRTAPRGSARGIPMFLLGVAAGIVLWFVLRADAELPIERQRDTLLATRNATRLQWKAGPSPLRGLVEGDVVWSHDSQRGFLRFRGLPPLDDDRRFQLWIVDGNRDGAPVDGGLFSVADAGADTIVPIRAALPIGSAKAFVVTVEPRGGVVVSKQEHVVAIAGL